MNSMTCLERKTLRYKGYYYRQHPCSDYGWYCMDMDQLYYLHMDGSLNALCGEHGYWDNEEQLRAFIDAIVERDEIKKGLFKKSEFEI